MEEGYNGLLFAISFSFVAHFIHCKTGSQVNRNAWSTLPKGGSFEFALGFVSILILIKSDSHHYKYTALISWLIGLIPLVYKQYRHFKNLNANPTSWLAVNLVTFVVMYKSLVSIFID